MHVVVPHENEAVRVVPVFAELNVSKLQRTSSPRPVRRAGRLGKAEYAGQIEGSIQELLSLRCRERHSLGIPRFCRACEAAEPAAGLASISPASMAWLSIPRTTQRAFRPVLRESSFAMRSLMSAFMSSRFTSSRRLVANRGLRYWRRTLSSRRRWTSCTPGERSL